MEKISSGPDLPLDLSEVKHPLIEATRTLLSSLGKKDIEQLIKDALALREQAANFVESVKQQNLPNEDLVAIIAIVKRMKQLLPPELLKQKEFEPLRPSLTMVIMQCGAAEKAAQQKLSPLKNEKKRSSLIPSEEEALVIAKKRIRQFIKFGILTNLDRLKAYKNDPDFSATESADDISNAQQPTVYINLFLSTSGSNTRIANILDDLEIDTSKGPIHVALEKQGEGNDWWFSTLSGEIKEVLEHRARYSAMMIMTVKSLEGNVENDEYQALKRRVAELEQRNDNADAAHEYPLHASIKPGSVLYILAPSFILQEIKAALGELHNSIDVKMIAVDDMTSISIIKEKDRGEQRVRVNPRVPDYHKAMRPVLMELVKEWEQVAVVHITRLH